MNTFKLWMLATAIALGFAFNPAVYANEKPKNIILLIGDGMGVAHIQAAMAVADNTLHMAKFKHVGLMTTDSADDYVTDSAAGGTAIATGAKTNNGMVSVSPDGKPLKTILEYAEENGLSTGLVSTSSILHATPASFIAHEPDRDDYKLIAGDFLDTEIEVFIGGGYKDFEQGPDNRNLINELNEKNYTVVDNLDDMQSVESGKLAGLMADKHLERYTKGRGDFLIKSTQKAIEILSAQPNGFFLMVEGSQIDWGGHANLINYVTSELIDFDNAVGAALAFAENNKETLIIVTSDHETGGLLLYNDKKNPGTPDFKFKSRHHTGVMVPVLSYGPGAESFTGFMDNTDIFHKMKSLYGF